MTIVRGKQPLKLRSVSNVEAKVYAQEVRVYVRGSDGGDNWFDAFGDLSPECAADLVRKLRQALRQVRDESHRRLERAVNQAEGQL